MLIMTIDERYNQIMNEVEAMKSTCSRLSRMGVQAINQVSRFMIFTKGYDIDCDDKEYGKWLICKFFDDKLYEDEAFAKRRGVGAGTVSFLRIVAENLQKSV
jgi:hypothetical protein